MTKEIRSIILEDEGTVGNILGPQGFGWSNKYSRWFLGGTPTLGNPQISNYYSYRWVNGQPYFSQPPQRRSTGIGSFLHPVPYSTNVPPLTDLSSY